MTVELPVAAQIYGMSTFDGRLLVATSEGTFVCANGVCELVEPPRGEYEPVMVEVDYFGSVIRSGPRKPAQ